MWPYPYEAYSVVKVSIARVGITCKLSGCLRGVISSDSALPKVGAGTITPSFSHDIYCIGRHCMP